MTEKTQLNPFVKLALDIGPLILFFVVNAKAGIFAAPARLWSPWSLRSSFPMR